ncbi:pantoate--beta-alanine ligase [Legionella sp. km772]|uniref:pantoate--beta-alanine ligase n=1 Tax=Legionella sp. km772 TaxID=2498111 RepID=UPI000F8DA440|nr:pantoate--beta-alanine ligase [Legionella sp. km772]RUR05330.1 pantoate--beta-alanine ligase [Legionella sp. km772]
MQIFNTLEDWRTFRKSLSPSKQIGFAPTMGNLHEGHKSLFVKSKQENDYTASSLFVNPTQFNRSDDFTHYPRTLDTDLQLMTQAGVDFCLLPQQEEIYSDGYNYQIQENNLCMLMEGTHRPGHFNGVLTVVMKLLQLVKPNRAYFGEKDYQQYLLIKGMVEAFFMDIEIIPCPTIRELSGLAYSSRNNRLTKEQKILAEEFAQIFHQNKPCAMIIETLQEKGIGVEYIEEHRNRRFAAVIIGDIRLIDNYAL